VECRLSRGVAGPSERGARQTPARPAPPPPQPCGRSTQKVLYSLMILLLCHPRVHPMLRSLVLTRQGWTSQSVLRIGLTPYFLGRADRYFRSDAQVTLTSERVPGSLGVPGSEHRLPLRIMLNSVGWTTSFRTQTGMRFAARSCQSAAHHEDRHEHMSQPDPRRGHSDRYGAGARRASSRSTWANTSAGSP
jgi:hypothetical protein